MASQSTAGDRTWLTRGLWPTPPPAFLPPPGGRPADFMRCPPMCCNPYDRPAIPRRRLRRPDKGCTRPGGEATMWRTARGG